MISKAFGRFSKHLLSLKLLSRLTLRLCLLAIIFASSSVPLMGQTTYDWAEFHTTNMQRRNPSETVLNVNNVGGLELAWSFKTGSFVFSSPAVFDGVAYVGSNDGNFYAVNAISGAKLWVYATGDAVFSSPAVANGVVYVGSDNGNVYALNANTGSELWVYATGTVYSSVYSSPAVANGVVYVGSDDYNVYALNANTGAKLWSYPTGFVVDSSPAIANGVVYVGSDDYNVYALSASTGAELWAYTTGNAVNSSPAVANGVVYVGSFDGNVYALNANTGVKLWSYTTGNQVTSSPAVSNGVVYVASWDGNLYALNATTGVKLWSYPTDFTTFSSPAVANGVVYVGSYNGNLYALNANTGAKLWSYTTGSSVISSPAVANGVVYVGSDDQTLYSFSLPTTQSSTMTSLSSSLNPSVFGQAITFDSQVRPLSGTGVPTGTVTFAESGTTLAVVTLNGGTAKLPISTLPTGLNPITAVYSGDPNYAPSVSPVLDEQVNLATSVAVLASSPNPSQVNQPVTFTVTVTGQYGGTPTGTVTFHEKSIVLGTAELVNAQGTLAHTFTTARTVTITATYAGDMNYLPSTSINLTQIVGYSSLAKEAADLARSLLGAEYGYGGKGYDFDASLYVNSSTIFGGYDYYRADCTTGKQLGLLFGKGVDCSGLVLWSYNTAFGATTPFEQLDYPITYPGSDGLYLNNTNDVAEADLQPGDLLFFDYDNRSDTLTGRPLAGHVAMYVGEDDVVEAYTCDPKYKSGDYVILSSKNTRAKLDPITGQVLKRCPATFPQAACFIGYRRVKQPDIRLMVEAQSTVTLSVTDPDGFTITADTVEFTEREVLREIPGILYYLENTDGDDMVISPVVKKGTYLIKVFPKPGTAPSHTYSLEVNAAGRTLVLAQSVPLSSIPTQGYSLEFNGAPLHARPPVAAQQQPYCSK
ncbi:MAG: PQQ-binding-like beta-propeller repeat protein [Candidatus Sulfotelmatobacter sp.]